MEVKYGYDRLREDQVIAHELLKKHGFLTRVERVPIKKHPRLYEAWLKDNPADRTLSTPRQTIPDQSNPSQNIPTHDSPIQPTPIQITSYYIPQPSPNQTILGQPNPNHPNPDHPRPYQPKPANSTPGQFLMEEVK